MRWGETASEVAANPTHFTEAAAGFFQRVYLPPWVTSSVCQPFIVADERCVVDQLHQACGSLPTPMPQVRFAHLCGVYSRLRMACWPQESSRPMSSRSAEASRHLWSTSSFQRSLSLSLLGNTPALRPALEFTKPSCANRNSLSKTATVLHWFGRPTDRRRCHDLISPPIE
jgi:hypothetical protein